MANDRNLDRNIASARNLLRLLIDIQAAPSEYNSDNRLLETLNTQINLGKLNIPERSIYLSSMSTLKRVSDKHLEGGFAELDKQRKRAYADLR